MTTLAPTPPPTRTPPAPMSGAEPVRTVVAPPIITRRAALVWACLFVMAMGWDRATWLLVSAHGKPRLEWLESLLGPEAIGKAISDGRFADAIAGGAYSLVYSFGRVWVWVLVAAVLVFRDWASPKAAVRSALRRGAMVVLAPVAAGLVAEALKLITRRQRPELTDGVYSFKPLAAGVLDAGNVGLASSHASVAVAAAMAAGLVFPRARWALWPLAILCCLSRVAVGAHYLSDVLVGALLGVLAFKALYALDLKNNAGVPMPVRRSQTA